MMIQLSQKGLLLSLFLIVFALSAATYRQHVAGSTEPGSIALETLPVRLDQWEGRDAPGGLDDDVRNVLQLDKFVKRSYANHHNDEVTLYIGYWSTQSGEHQAAKHSPSICLPANGWSITRQPKEYISFDDPSLSPLHVKRVVGGMRDRQVLFTYWFFTGEHTYNEEWTALARISFEAAVHGRSDGGIVEVATPIEHHRDATFEEMLENARARSDEFIRSLYPELHTIITSPDTPL